MQYRIVYFSDWAIPQFNRIDIKNKNLLFFPAIASRNLYAAKPSVGLQIIFILLVMLLRAAYRGGSLLFYYQIIFVKAM